MLLLFSAFEGRSYPNDIVVRADLLSLKSELGMYKERNGFYPTTEQGLHAFVAMPQSSPIPQHWVQLLHQDRLDPWHHPYVYRLHAKDPSTFDVFSLGPDGVESNDDIRLPR